MKKFSISCTVGMIFMILVVISFGSCSKENKPGDVRKTKEAMHLKMILILK